MTSEEDETYFVVVDNYEDEGPVTSEVFDSAEKAARFLFEYDAETDYFIIKRPDKLGWVYMLPSGTFGTNKGIEGVLRTEAALVEYLKNL